LRIHQNSAARLRGTASPGATIAFRKSDRPDASSADDPFGDEEIVRLVLPQR
jgi:hypothetical protein